MLPWRASVAPRRASLFRPDPYAREVHVLFRTVLVHSGWFDSEPIRRSACGGPARGTDARLVACRGFMRQNIVSRVPMIVS